LPGGVLEQSTKPGWVEISPRGRKLREASNSFDPRIIHYGRKRRVSEKPRGEKKIRRGITSVKRWRSPIYMTLGETGENVSGGEVPRVHYKKDELLEDRGLKTAVHCK